MVSDHFVIIVSGLPRSGTSVMMQMLAAGGVELLTDSQRQADVDNPRGYLELEAVKVVARDSSFLDGADGKAVKMIHALLTAQLPLDRRYRVIFMRRDLNEVLASQRKMLDRHGQAGAALTDARLKAVYARQVQQTLRWLAERSDFFRVLEVDYAALVSDARSAAKAVNEFLEGGLDEDAMAAAVDPSLHRNRRQAGM